MAYEINVQGSKNRKTVLASKGLEGMGGGGVHFKIVIATGGGNSFGISDYYYSFFGGGG